MPRRVWFLSALRIYRRISHSVVLFACKDVGKPLPDPSVPEGPPLPPPDDDPPPPAVVVGEEKEYTEKTTVLPIHLHKGKITELSDFRRCFAPLCHQDGSRRNFSLRPSAEHKTQRNAPKDTTEVDL